MYIKIYDRQYLKKFPLEKVMDKYHVIFINPSVRLLSLIILIDPVFYIFPKRLLRWCIAVRMLKASAPPWLHCVGREPEFVHKDAS